jgi:hypothetical protein
MSWVEKQQVSLLECYPVIAKLSHHIRERRFLTLEVKRCLGTRTATALFQSNPFTQSFVALLKDKTQIVMVDLLARHADFRQNLQRQRRDRGMRVGKCRLHPTLLNDYATVMAELK